MRNIQIKTVILSILCLALCQVSFAQDRSDDLLKRRAAEKVGQFYDYISFIASKQKSLEVRKIYCTKAVRLFFGNGDEFTDEYGNKKEGAMMQITSVNNTIPRTRTVKSYLSALANLGYQDVEITSTDVQDMKVSELKKIGDGVYSCTCYVEQLFSVKRDGVLIPIDTTRKYYKCYVFIEHTEEGDEYIVRLGDVYATETLRGDARQLR